MKRMMIIFIVMIGFCLGLFGQPKPFDPDYYRDTLKVKKSNDFKNLENYREKYKKTGLPSALSDWHEKQYPSYFADWFYHRGINVDKILEYKKLRLFLDDWPSSIDRDILGNIFRPIIVIARLTSFQTKEYNDDIATFEVIKIIKGREYYVFFPDSIKCYSMRQGTITDAIGEGRDTKLVDNPLYFSKHGPVHGDEFILYLDIFKKDNVDILRKNGNEFGRIDVFYNIEGEYLNYTEKDFYEKNKSRGQAKIDKLLEKLKKLDELNIKR